MREGPTTRELIAKVNDQLTPTERRLAQAVLDEPTLLAFGTVTDLAERADTSRPSVVRFATKLGFDGYTDLQQHARDDLSRRLARPSERIRAGEHVTVSDRLDLTRALETTLSRLTEAQLARLARPLVSARNLWVLSGETSMAAAHALASGMAMLREGVHVVDDHALGRSLNGARGGDTAVVIDFYRYRRTTQLAARALVDRGVELVAITDGPLSPLASLTDAWCEVTVPAIGPFDASSPAVAVCELIVAHVARTEPEAATASIDRTEAMWEATETFVD